MPAGHSGGRRTRHGPGVAPPGRIAITFSDGRGALINFRYGYGVADLIEHVYDSGMSSTATLDPEPAMCCDAASEVASLAGAANVVMARLVAVVAEAMAAG